MIFEVEKGIYWDTESEIQSESAQSWLFKLRQTEATKLIKDNYGRPCKFIWELPECTVIVEKEFVYKESSDWTLHKDNITVLKK